MKDTLQRPTGAARWWVYQSERFPLADHGPLIAAFSFSAVCFSAQLRQSTPTLASALVALPSSFVFFLLLRITDEFKDAEEDARYRPYRPVPRGLLSLRELGVLGIGAALFQAFLAFAFKPSLLILLLSVWAYLGLMTREFFVPKWLRSHPIHYLWSHMLIMPLIDLYVTACDWWGRGGPPSGLVWLLLLSFLNGVVVEIGRKIRAPADEERGVETYSFLWGRRCAIAVWLGIMAAAGIAAITAAHRVRFGIPVLLLTGSLFTVSAACAGRFLRHQAPGSGKLIENLSGLWTLLVYTSCGVIPMLLEMVRR